MKLINKIEQRISFLKKVIKNIKVYGIKNTISKVVQSGLFTKIGAIRTYWFERKEIKNFGDMITPYLVKKITGKKAFRVNKHCARKYYIICGSVLGAANNNAIIWGAGIIRRNTVFKKPKKVCAVRGPITRKTFLELGYKCPKIFGDPGLLLPIFFKPKSRKEYDIGIIPHYVDYTHVNINYNDFFVIDLLAPVEEVIENINKCKIIISSSLHGLIISHAYNISSLWVEFSDNLTGDGVKFFDYFYSVKISPYKPLNFKNKTEIDLNRLKKVFLKNPKRLKPSKCVLKSLQKNLLNTCPLPISNKAIEQ